MERFRPALWHTVFVGMEDAQQKFSADLLPQNSGMAAPLSLSHAIRARGVKTEKGSPCIMIYGICRREGRTAKTLRGHDTTNYDGAIPVSSSHARRTGDA